MSLTNYLRSALLGAALAFGCGPKDGFDDDDQVEETLEVRVQRDVTDRNGQAFDGAQEILVRDEGTPVANEEVTLYSVISQGDIYLTEANGSGIALFPDSRRRHGRSSGRELNVNEPQPVQGSSESLLSGLLRWSLADFSCVSAESVPANGVPRIIIYSDENGRQVAFGGDYSRLRFDEPHTFYSFDPVGEGVPLIIPDEIAQAVFSESLYERIRRECRGGSSASCSGEVLFEDEFEGKELDNDLWDRSDGLPCNVYRLNDGVLEFNPSRGSCILQSRSRYSLSDGPLCFEARWRVREREGTGFDVGFHDLMSNAVFYNVRRSDDSEFCSTVINGKLDAALPCETDVIQWNTYRLVSDGNSIQHYMNGQTIAEHTRIPNGNLPVNIGCDSNDDKEKECSVDYIRVSR